MLDLLKNFVKSLQSKRVATTIASSVVLIACDIVLQVTGFEVSLETRAMVTSFIIALVISDGSRPVVPVAGAK